MYEKRYLLTSFVGAGVGGFDGAGVGLLVTGAGVGVFVGCVYQKQLVIRVKRYFLKEIDLEN